VGSFVKARQKGLVQAAHFQEKKGDGDGVKDVKAQKIRHFVKK